MENESQSAIHTSVPFRVRVGVTGHRELPAPQALSSKIKEVIERNIPELFDNESKKLLRSSSHTPIAHTVVTPLAQGADRLLAREVLKHPLADIEVVLPLHKEDYLKDFDSSESRQEFEELFAKARRPIVRCHVRCQTCPVSDLPNSTNFDNGASCPDIPESMRKDCSIM